MRQVRGHRECTMSTEYNRRNRRNRRTIRHAARDSCRDPRGPCEMYRARAGIQEEIGPEICEGVENVGVSISGGLLTDYAGCQKLS